MTQRNDELKRNDTLQNSTNSVIRVSRTRAAHWVASPIGKSEKFPQTNNFQSAIQFLGSANTIALFEKKEKKNSPQHI